VVSNDCEKYRELYVLAKEAFGEELSRSFRIDEKASKYLSVVTLLLGIFGSFGGRILSSNIPPKNLLDHFALLLGMCAFGSLIYTWLILFQILRVHDFKKIPIPVEFFESNSLPDIYRGMAQGLKDNLAINRNLGDRKARLLWRGHLGIIAVTICLLSLSGLLVENRWNNVGSKAKERMTSMADEQEKPVAPVAPAPVSQVPSGVRPPVVPPAFDTVNEGLDPSTGNTRDVRSTPKTGGKK
jgi:hypothetical protein